MCIRDRIEEDIQNLVKDIYQYKKVAAFGYMQSENIALNLQFDLQTSGKILFTCIKFINQVEYIQNADEETLIIIFSESGTYFDRVFQRSKPFKNLKVKPKIYMITSNFNIFLPYVDAVSYTHLDVYKRQHLEFHQHHIL